MFFSIICWLNGRVYMNLIYPIFQSPADTVTHTEVPTQDRITRHGTHLVLLELAAHILYQTFPINNQGLLEALCLCLWTWPGEKAKLLSELCVSEMKREAFECKAGPFQAFCPSQGFRATGVQRATFEEMSEEQKGRNSDVMDICWAIG